MSPERTEETTGEPTPAAELSRLAERVIAAVETQVVGQRPALEALLVAYMASGHALLEGVPGIGKTLMARSLSGALGLGFQRVQFTPDLMPADVIGTNIFHADSGELRLLRGPVFTEILLADEINRTPPKTQSALLEAMQERQVTIDGETCALAADFFVIATQNPVEHEGTYPLPEAQLDRFLARVEMSLPDPEAELDLFRRAVAGTLREQHAPTLEPVITREEAGRLRRAHEAVHVSEELLEYLSQLARSTRSSEQLELAISPRGALSLLAAARAAAVLAGRDFVLPDDFKQFLRPCWGHRLILSAEAELEGHSASKLLQGIADAVEVPKG